MFGVTLLSKVCYGGEALLAFLSSCLFWGFVCILITVFKFMMIRVLRSVQGQKGCYKMMMCYYVHISQFFLVFFLAVALVFCLWVEERCTMEACVCVKKKKGSEGKHNKS